MIPMIWWLVDNPNTVYISLGLVAIVFLALFWNDGRVKNLVCVAIVVLIGVLLWLLTLTVMTDRGQIRSNMEEIALGAVRHDSQKMRKFLSDTFEYGHLKGKDSADHVVDTAKHFGVNGYKIWDFEVEQLSHEKREAKIFFRLRVDALDGQFLGACRGTFVLEGDTWRLKTIQMFKFVGDAEQPYQPPLR